MSCATGTEQAVCSTMPRGPEISTRHMRQQATGSSLGWLQKTGISMPSLAAASTTSVPLGTETWRSSMVSVTSRS